MYKNKYAYSSCVSEKHLLQSIYTFFHTSRAGVVWYCFVAGKGKGEQRFCCLLYPEAVWVEKADGMQPLADESGLREPFLRSEVSTKFVL